MLTAALQTRRRLHVGREEVLGINFYFLKLVDAQNLQRQLFIEWFRHAGLDFAQEIFLKPNLGHMDPFARRSPIDIARRYLRLGNKGHTGIAKICEACSIPGSTLSTLALQIHLI